MSRTSNQALRERHLPKRRDSGILLLELIIALGIFTVGVLGLFGMLRATFGGNETTANIDRARVALENVAEMLRRANFGDVHATYNGASFEAPDLMGLNGQPAQVRAQCFVNELSIPSEFGPVIDLDGGGGLITPDCSSTYKLLPVRLSLEYVDSSGATHRPEIFVLLEKGS